MPTPASALPPGISFQAALANLSGRVVADIRTTSAGPRTHSAASSPSRQESKPQAQPLLDDTATATAPIPPADLVAAQAKDSSDGQESTGDVFSNTLPQTPDICSPVTSPDQSPQIPLVQPKADALNQSETPLPQSSAPAPQNNAVAAIVQADAATIPTASSAAAVDAAPAVPSIPAQPAAETFKLHIAPQPTAMLQNKADAIQPAGKASQKNATDAIGLKNADGPNAMVPTQSKAASTAGDAPSHGAQNNSQSNSPSNNRPAQHSQVDASQPAVVMPKVVDSGAAQAQPIQVPAVSHETSPATRTLSNSLSDASRAERGDPNSRPLDGDEVTPATGINATRIVQSMSETEMRVGLHSNEFGAISIRTTVSPQQMLAQISLDHPGLSQAISAHVDSMQTKLGNDSGLNTLIQVNHQAASTAGQGNSQPREQRSFAPSGPVERAAVPADPDVGVTPAPFAGASSGYRLDIRA